MNPQSAVPRRPSAARASILAAADRLFYAEGIRAVGVDRVVSEAQVTRVTFYRHFPSKDDLIAAYLQQRLHRDQGQLAQLRREHPDDPLAVLSGIDPAELIRAIGTQDVARLTRIPGVGKKTAERIGLELKDRLPPTGMSPAGETPAGGDTRDDLLSALVNLGYQRPVAEKAVDAVLKKSPGGDFEVLLREILRGMMK